MPSVSASYFKARCLALFDEVAEAGTELVVTKHGRPVAKVVPVDREASLEGSVRMRVSAEEMLAPLGEPWEASGE